MSKAGRYGGTYAHKDIAFEFGMWISPKFKLLLLIKEKEKNKMTEELTEKELEEYRISNIRKSKNHIID